jgi:ABC-type multidrug transport system permease subunit
MQDLTPAEPDAERTEAQREWADWAAHGYRKLYQPRSMLVFGGVFFALFGAALVIVVWLATSGRWP